MAIKCTTHTNSTCIKCNVLEEEMIYIGAFIMCKKCWKKEFGAKTTLSESNKVNYKKWLDVYFKQYGV